MNIKLLPNEPLMNLGSENAMKIIEGSMSTSQIHLKRLNY